MYTCTRTPATRIGLENTITRVGVRAHAGAVAGKHETYSEAENRILRAALRELRAKRKLSQEALGKLLGISQQNAGNLAGSVPSMGMGRPTANRLAVALGFPHAEELLLAHDVGGSHGHGEWSNREAAVRAGRLLGFEAAAIEVVVHQYSSAPDARIRPVKWWITKFGEQERETAADRGAAFLRANLEPPPKRRAKKSA